MLQQLFKVDWIVCWDWSY